MRRREFLQNTALFATGISIVPAYVLGGARHVAPSDQISIGIIGTGKQARGLASRFAQIKDARILAGADVDQQKLTLFKKHLLAATAENSVTGSECEIYTDYHEMLDRDDIDAVIVATPDHWHAINSIDAMKAGKDVYCEKPLAHTVDEGRRMVKAVKKYKKVLQTGSMQRSRENFRHAAELVRNGYLGEVQKVLVNVGDPGIHCSLPAMETPTGLDWDRWLGPAPYRGYNPGIAPPVEEDVWAQWRRYLEYGGGILSDWGAHMFDIAQWGLGMDHSGPVLFVPPTDPLAVRGLQLIYDNGVQMIHQDFGRGWAVRFIGTEGTLDVSRRFLDSDPANIVEVKLGPNEKRLYKSDNHYTDWINAIKKRSLPICDVETGHRSSSVCNLANIAYQLRRPVRWDPVKEKFVKNKEANEMLKKKYRSPYKMSK